MDDLTYDILSKKNLPNTKLIHLSQFEEGDKSLLSAKNNRSIVEYYFTCTPSLPLYILNNYALVEKITYIDSDFFFYSDPTPVFNEIGDHPITITPHSFPDNLKHLEMQYGVFNVGWLTFSRSDEAFDCLTRWRNQCLEWCYDRLEEGRFADQMYLDEWPERYPNLLVLAHMGVNVAPCNLARYKINFQNQKITLDGKPIVCFHFFGLKSFRSFIYYFSLKQWGVDPTNSILDGIYEPYLRALKHSEELVSNAADIIVHSSSAREITVTSKNLPTNDSKREEILRQIRYYKSVISAIFERRFIVFFRNRIVLKFIPCGLSRNHLRR